MKNPTGFDPRLESLRGIAALAVVIAHSMAIFRIDGFATFWALPLSEHTPSMWPLDIIGALFNAGSAVILFFVLSGYVLTLSLKRATQSIGAYIVRRIFRLMPPMWVSIIVMWMTLTAIQIPDMQPYSTWFSSLYVPIDASGVVSNLVLWSFKGNPITWTMYVEFIGSALVPISLWVSVRYGTMACYVMLVVLMIPTALNYHYLTFAYLVCFQAGATIALSPPRIAAQPWTLAIAGYLLFVIGGLAIKPSAWSIWMNTIGASLILIAVTNGSVERLLGHQFIRNIGRVSYSVYLFQLPVIFVVGVVVARFFEPGLLATTIALALILGLTLLTANISYALFERPSIQAGRELSRRI